MKKLYEKMSEKQLKRAYNANRTIYFILFFIQLIISLSIILFGLLMYGLLDSMIQSDEINQIETNWAALRGYFGSFIVIIVFGALWLITDCLFFHAKRMKLKSEFAAYYALLFVKPQADGPVKYVDPEQHAQKPTPAPAPAPKKPTAPEIPLGVYPNNCTQYYYRNNPPANYGNQNGGNRIDYPNFY